MGKFFSSSMYLVICSKCFFPYMPERRQAEAARIREKYPDRIPV